MSIILVPAPPPANKKPAIIHISYITKLGFPTQNRKVLSFAVSSEFYTDWPVR